MGVDETESWWLMRKIFWYDRFIDTIVEQILIYESQALQESFYYSDLPADEQDELYGIFKDSYEKAVGASWDRGRFESRAYDWLFFGKVQGGIAAREQRSGLVKLVAAFGATGSIVKAFYEMQNEIGHKPIWGVMTLNLAEMLEKISRKEFKIPPKQFVKILIPHIKHIFGDVVLEVNKNGGIVVETPAGPMEKYFIANKNYYHEMLDKAKEQDLPIPGPVLKIVVGLLKKFV